MVKKKISFRVPPGLWERFSRQATELFLNRAPFLDHMIRRELPELQKELGERRLSNAAKRYISGQLKRQGAKSVNIEVDERTANALNEAVRQSNLVRDAFLCRLLIFLRSTDALLELLNVPRQVRSTIHYQGGGIELEEMPTSPMGAMEAVRDDPLYYLRSYIEQNGASGLYLVQLPKKLDWAACFIEDKDVPGTRAFKLEERATAELYEIFETAALLASAKSEQKASKK